MYEMLPHLAFEGPQLDIQPITPAEEYGLTSIPERFAYMGAHRLGLLAAHSLLAQELPPEDFAVVHTALTYEDMRSREARVNIIDHYNARHDELTGLYNRRALEPAYEQLRNNMNRRNDDPGVPTPSSVAIIDLDLFKHVNDTYGHDTGDLVIKGVAGVLLGNLRSTDTAIRYGGEEFVVMLGGSNIDEARHIAERLRNRIKTKIMSRTKDGTNVSVTASIGIAPLDFGTSLGENMGTVDKALYHAKWAGRDRVVSSTDLPVETDEEI